MELSNRGSVDNGIENGIQWKTVEMPNLIINGYVKVPENHPWQKFVMPPNHTNTAYDTINCLVDSELVKKLVGGARCLTYSDDRGWVGFDTMHYGDCWFNTKNIPDGAVLWDKDLVVEQIKIWANIIKEAWGKQVL